MLLFKAQGFKSDLKLLYDFLEAIDCILVSPLLGRNILGWGYDSLARNIGDVKPVSSWVQFLFSGLTFQTVFQRARTI